VTFFKKTKPGRIAKPLLSDFIDYVLHLCAVISSADTFHFAQLQDEDTVLVAVFRDSLIGDKFRKSEQQIKVHQPIDRVTRGLRQFYIFLKSGEVWRLDLDGTMVKMSTNSSGSVYIFDRCVGNESNFASCFAEGGRVSVRKYPRLPITQIVPKQYGGNSAYSAITEIADRVLQVATRRILFLAAQKVHDPKAFFNNSLMSAPFDTIVIVFQLLECIIISTIPNDVRVHTSTALIKVVALNLNCFGLSKTQLELFLVERIQKILTNIPICIPTYDSLFLLF
jgi:hypothetical protein